MTDEHDQDADPQEIQQRVKEAFIESDQQSMSEAFSELLAVLDDEQKYEMFSDINKHELRQLTVMKTLGDEMTEKLVETYMRMKVSYRREGRDEVVEIAKAMGAFNDEEEGMTIAEKIRGAFS